MIGSRCPFCYVAAQGVVHGVQGRLWWTAHWRAFAVGLQSRYRTIQAGLEPGDVEELVNVFRKGTIHCNLKVQGPSDKIRRIVRNADRLARRQRG